MKGQGRRDLERRESAELFRCVLDELVEHGKQRAGVLQVVEDRPGEHLAHLVQPVFQRRHHAEIAAAPAQPPKQVLILIRAGGHEPSLRGDHVGGDEVVDREPARPCQVADATPQGQARDAGARDDAARRRQAERVGGVVEVPPGGAGISAGHLVPRIHAHGPHR
jgi:hypothetical protein